jgi:hypothetical protein
MLPVGMVFRPGSLDVNGIDVQADSSKERLRVRINFIVYLQVGPFIK